MSETTKVLLRLRELGLSQTEIARQTGIPQPRLSKWESGQAPAGADDALRLDRLLSEKLAAVDDAPTTPNTSPNPPPASENAGAAATEAVAQGG